MFSRDRRNQKPLTYIKYHTTAQDQGVWNQTAPWGLLT